MNLEQRVTRGAIFYIDSIEYDVINRSLTIRFMGHPETNHSIVRILTFQSICDFEDWIDEDEYDLDCTDSLMGIQEHISDNDGTEYVIATEQREISFRSEMLPEVIDID